jgi:glyoxylase-like metal-dependent hydrolase (beta-lactamase superfamily II)
MDFRPDVALPDREVVRGDGWTLEAVTTPGHTANHMAFAFRESDVLFSGDHVMAWSTPVVAPPDGSMSDYMASLQKLARRGEPVYFPGHGPAVRNAPRFVAAYILHRKAREASILNRLAKGESDIPALVAAIYANLDPRLTKAAGLSVLAHLEDLVARGAVATDGEASIAGRYRLAA